MTSFIDTFTLFQVSDGSIRINDGSFVILGSGGSSIREFNRLSFVQGQIATIVSNTLLIRNVIVKIIYTLVPGNIINLSNQLIGFELKSTITNRTNSITLTLRDKAGKFSTVEKRQALGIISFVPSDFVNIDLSNIVVIEYVIRSFDLNSNQILPFLSLGPVFLNQIGGGSGGSGGSINKCGY